MKVRGLGEGIYFETIRVFKAANQHSTCKYRQRLAEENIPAYQNAVGKKIAVELDNGRPIFFGEVTEVFLERTYHGNYVEICATSASLKTDLVAETRIFQNPEKLFREILNAGQLNLRDCSLDVEDSLAANPCREIILQDGETNFEFIKRLTTWQGRRVWVRDTFQGKCELRLASCSDDSTNKLLREEIISLRLGQRGKIRAAELVTAKYFELGRLLTLNDMPCKFLIVEAETYEERGVERMRFVLEELQPPKPTDLPELPPVKLKAKVVSVGDEKNLGRIRVQFAIEDKALKKAWLPYRTPYSGITFLPEVGEEVEVFYTRGEGYVTSTLRTKTLDEEFRNVAGKYLSNNRKQRIFLREKSLELKSAETSIFMDEKKIVLSVGENKIIMDEQGLTLKTSGEFKSEVAKGFTLKTGGAVEVSASGATKIKGSTVELG